MLHAPANEAQYEAAGKRSHAATQRSYGPDTGIVPPFAGNQALLLARAAGAAAPPRPSRAPVLQRKCACGGASGQCAACAEKETHRLQQRTNGAAAVPEIAPPIVHDVLRAAGCPLDDDTRASMERDLGYDFATVRVHTDGQAARSAASVGALAYTVGNRIVFSGGMYQPGSEAGRRLIAHELVHVVQQGGTHPPPSPVLSIDPDPSSEREADRAAERLTQGAPAGPPTASTASASLQRQTPTPAPSAAPAAATAGTGAFASEPPDMKTKRLEAIAAARNAITRLGNGMQSGYLWPGEVVSPQGDITVSATTTNLTQTKAQRDTRLQALRADLVALIQTLESGPIPQAWLAPQANFPATAAKGGTSITAWAKSQSYIDVMMFYANRAAGQGRDADIVFVNWTYIETDPIPKKSVAPKAIGNAIETGTQIVVEDPENKPLEARLAGKTDGTTKETQLYSLWKDDLGYFYIYNNERHYLKDRPVHY